MSTSIRPWKVVLLADLALLLGVGFGYAWWGREATRLRVELVEARARPAVTEWTARGVVRAVLPEMQVLVLTHEDIAGFMPGMTMGFRAESPAVYRGIEVGDEIRFTLKGVGSNVVITSIEKLQ